MTSADEIYSWSPSKVLKVDDDVIRRTCNAFNVELSNTIDCYVKSHKSLTFPRLSDENVRQLFKSLAERRDRKTARKISTLIDRWKDSVAQNQSDAFEYESIAKHALGSNAPVRFSQGRNYTISQKEIEAYKDLYRLSQSFISNNYQEGANLYRGVRDLSVAKLFAQALDRPDASKYVIDTSVISNFTATRQVGRDYCSGIMIKSPLISHCTVMMVDHIFPTSDPEDEVHVAGGKISLPPENIIHVGNHTQDDRKLQTTVKNLDKEYNIPEKYLEDILSIFEIMGANEIGVRTQEGRDRIDNWMQLYQSNIDSQIVSQIEPLIYFIKNVDKSKEWVH